MNETCFITLKSGRQLCYAEYGDPEGVPLMYFHGWPSSRLQAFSLDPICREKGVRLIAPDRPGIGQSEPELNRTLRDWPPVVVELADALGIGSFLVMGVSGGGPYAVATAEALPDRVMRAAVVCVAPPLEQFPDRREMMWPYRALLQIRPHAPFLIPSILRFSHWASQFPANKPPMSWILKWTSEADQKALEGADSFEVVTRSFREGLSMGAKGVQLDGDVYTSEWGVDYEQVKVPIEFWHGEDDRNIPFSMVREYASWIPTAETHYFPGEGHYSIISMASKEVVLSLLNAIQNVGEKSECMS